MTDQSDILPEENVLHLSINSASLEPSKIAQLCGGEIRSYQVQTFLAVDFFNHDSKNTDLTEGFNPIYATRFSFKNHVDDFYIKHLEKDSILVDVFLVPPVSKNSVGETPARKIGSARLPLHRLLSKIYDN